MTDRVKGLVVVLEEDIREDDAEKIIEAVEMVKGVQSVDKNITEVDDYINRQKVVNKISKDIFEVLTKYKEGDNE